MSSNIRARSDSSKGFLYALAGTALVSTNFVTAKYGLNGFNPETFSLIWVSAATVYSLIVVLATGRWRQLTSSAQDISKMTVMGLMTGVAMILGWAGLARLDPLFHAFLFRFTPVLTIALSALFLGERMMIKELVPVAVMVLGGSLSTVGRWHIVGIGTILVLFSCCASAVHHIIAKMMVAEVHPNILVFYRAGIAMLMIALWSFLTGRADFGAQASYWLVTLLGAFMGPCASFLLTFRSYRYWDLSRSAIVLTVQPLFVLPLAYLVFGELPTGMELVGGSLILVGAFWLAWIHRHMMSAT